MKSVFVATESDEYITLRNEMLTLFAHARQMLYWTTGFVIASIGWYIGNESAWHLPLWMFTLFLFAVLGVSCFAYAVNTIQVYRIGGFLAVFWESHEVGKYRIWHRVNRRGPGGGFLLDVATMVYTGDAVIVLGFFMAGLATGEAFRWNMFSSVSACGLGAILAFSQLSSYLRSRRDTYETELRAIKESPAKMKAIHSRYETMPSKIVLP